MSGDFFYRKLLAGVKLEYFESRLNILLHQMSASNDQLSILIQIENLFSLVFSKSKLTKLNTKGGGQEGVGGS